MVDQDGVTLFLMSLLVVASEGRNVCRDFQYLPCIENKIFKGHVIKRFKIITPGLYDCQNKCYHDNRCGSYNLGPVDGQSRTCELNDLDHVTHPDDVIDKPGSQYCPIMNPCSAKPCPANKPMCIPEFGFDSYRCFDKMWSQWSRWSSCPCPRFRSRVCRNILTKAPAKDCPGQGLEKKGSVHKNCAEVLQCSSKCTSNGVYLLNPDGGKDFMAYCDQETNGGGWAVIQKRIDGSVDFFRVWQDYKDGFGNLTGEYWLGLDNIYRLTHQTRNRLRVELEVANYAEYDNFAVSTEADNYKLILGAYSGTLGDSLRFHANVPFSTKDRDNDIMAGMNCAMNYKGGWWYKNCHNVNLNGLYLNGAHSSYADGINWKKWKGLNYSAKRAEMKIRPLN